MGGFPTSPPPFRFEPAALPTSARLATPPIVLGSDVKLVTEAIERLVKLRLSQSVTDAAARAELDAIIGLLTVSTVGAKTPPEAPPAPVFGGP